MKLKRSIQTNFAAIAESMPDRTALIDDRRRLTYGELALQSTAVAGYLAQNGVARGDRVGLYAPRSASAITAILGILKAGAVYVPFDPSYPAKLLKFIYDDCRPALMLVDSPSMDSGRAPFWEGPGHELEPLFAAAATDESRDTAIAGGPDDAAYIMYTSGSTAQPKGVLIPHRGVVRLVTDNPYASMGPLEVHLQLAPLAFDASTFEIWGALLNGGTLAVLQATHPSLDDIATAIKRHGVTTLWLTAGLFHLMVDHRLDGLKPLRQLLAGGDILSPTHVAKAQTALPHVQLINGYGPTENTTFTCCFRIPRSDSVDSSVNAPAHGMPAAIPIGSAIAHTTVTIVDESLHQVAAGEEGELIAGGAGVALGYWNRPELTAEKFIVDQADPSGQARCYRSGDRVRRRADGNIEFLGRVDRQVKLNGKRVELDAIEATLRRGPAVEDAVVICPAGDAGERKVHAYVKFQRTDPAAREALRAFLHSELPDYMVPATLTVMEALPLTPAGKIDRAALPLPRLPSAVIGGFPSGGRNPTEATLLAIWRDILGTEAIGLNDNFFDLGGTSVQLIAAHAKIAGAMQTNIGVVDLFQYATVSALAARIGRGTDSVPPPTAGAGHGGPLSAEERARRQQAALVHARSNVRGIPR